MARRPSRSPATAARRPAPRSQVPVVFTVGYGGRTPEGLLELLRARDVEIVCDVRFRPRSRWMLWANYYTVRVDGPLRQLIEKAGFEYRWLGRVLGNPKPREQSLSAFKTLLGREGEERTAELQTLAHQRRVCLLCASRDPVRCHRSVISRFLEQHGFQCVDV